MKLKNEEKMVSRIAGIDAFVSPVPLEKLNKYKLVYSSKGSNLTPSGGRIPEVKTFEYTPK
jgi:hypothetical protein